MQGIKKNCLFSFLIIVATAAASFFASTHDSIHEAEFSSEADGIVAQDYIWKDKSISVCWAEKDQAEELQQFSIMRTAVNETTQEIGESDKLFIQNKIQEQYNLKSVGIEFTGWKRCDSSVKSDIYIFAFDEMTYAEYFLPGEADIGTSCEMFNPDMRKKEIRHREPGQPGYLFLSKATVKKNSKAYKNPQISFARAAVHEFGHIAGLIHEHYHKDANQDPNCQEYIKEFPEFTQNPMNLGNDKAFSVYDPISIMNACFIFKEDEKEQQSLDAVKLSDLDRHTLQCIYKSAEDYDKSKCKPSDYK